jgi:hypothetical protein
MRLELTRGQRSRAKLRKRIFDRAGKQDACFEPLDVIADPVAGPSARLRVVPFAPHRYSLIPVVAAERWLAPVQ